MNAAAASTSTPAALTRNVDPPITHLPVVVLPGRKVAGLAGLAVRAKASVRLIFAGSRPMARAVVVNAVVTFLVIEQPADDVAVDLQGGLDEGVVPSAGLAPGHERLAPRPRPRAASSAASTRRPYGWPGAAGRGRRAGRSALPPSSAAHFIPHIPIGEAKQSMNHKRYPIRDSVNPNRL